jgi:hypothetical protein
MTTIHRGIRLVSCSVLLGLVPALAGCGLLGKKGGDAADAQAEAAVAEVAEAAPPPAATPAAANENDVSRFPDEKKLENVTATIQRPTNVREIPGIGKVVAALAKGSTVTEIAQRSTFFLVVFENPADKKQLMGWITQDSFTAPAPITAKPLACTLPETALFSDGPFCGKVCASDVDCPTGQACKGAANKFTNAKLGDAVTVCTVFTPAKPVATAITPVPAPTPVVAVVPTPAGIVGDPVGGKCAPNFTLLAKDNKCHKQCAQIGQCIPNGFCAACQGAKLCGATKDFCK